MEINKRKKIEIIFLMLCVAISTFLFCFINRGEPKKEIIYIQKNESNTLEDMVEIGLPSPFEKYDSVLTTDPSDNNWKIYENKTLGFKIKIPAIWEIEEDSESEFVSFHDSLYKNFVSVFPWGKGTESGFSPYIFSDVNITVLSSEKIDYITSKGDRYATTIRLVPPNNLNWNQYAMIDAQVDISGLEQICVSKITNELSESCDVWQGDQIVYVGKIKPEEREIIKKIIESFEFTDPTESTNTH